LNIHVLFQVTAHIGEVGEEEAEEHPLAPESATASPKVADALKEFWDKRTRDKAARPTPLHPRQTPRPGKAQFSWKPTRDLLRPRSSAVFIWAVIIIGALSIAAAFWYAKAFSPGPISQPHAQASLVHGTSAATAIAKKANAGSCTTCHAIKSSVEANCASCHQTEAFSATLTGIPAHAEAGIGCASCHTEHQGTDFRPAEAALNTCAKCHTDGNQNLYRGRRVFTPHGGTVGYPVVNGKWKWEGLDDVAWRQKPDTITEAMKRARERMPGETEDQWRSRQFHALHVYRVLVRDVGLSGNQDGEMSCSSCHSSFNPIDRVTPATTCARCHNGNNGQVDSLGQHTLIADNAPNCSSCHVQHVKEPGHWNPKLLAPAARRAEDERRLMATAIAH
jgi:Class III cytochrome C family